MKFLHPFLILSCLVGTALADAPRKAPQTRYTRLWTDSPFTTKPEIVTQAAQNPLGDYALGGITKLSDGYFVILLNKKKPEDPPVVIRPGSPSEFQVVDVKWSSGSWKETVVTLKNGRNEGSVTFDDALLVVKAPVAPPPAQNAKGQDPAPGQPGARTNGRTPRPRTIQPNANPQNPQPQRQQRENRR